MQAKARTSTALAAELILAFMPIFKGSQAEIMAATADLDLTLSQCRILLELERASDELSVNDLAASISLSIPATGRAIELLYRSGLLTRREDDTDRRMKRIGLTDKGLSVIATMTQVRNQGAERLVKALSAAEKVALAEAVTTIAGIVTTHLPVMYPPGGSASTHE